ncbi:uncharacterized protein LOC121417050 [Lytechinus variegatus]|uniref:uncharacterized protein LOC121417050 n=1 Tax=Lytechinus variegatus TaxID=7654 RepID=UPI001BB2BD17|nr:uncharacterized protein LOC121417050 [Lytechinus variegatus]
MDVKILIFVVALSFGSAYSQSCYRCASISSNNQDIDIPSSETGYPSCDDDSLQTVDCSTQGGCLKIDYSFQYNVDTIGPVSTDVVFRDCGTNLDRCESATEEQLNAQRDVINSMLPDGTEFVSGSGNACICSGNLCNGAPGLSISITALLASLLVSYIVIKW